MLEISQLPKPSLADLVKTLDTPDIELENNFKEIKGKLAQRKIELELTNLKHKLNIPPYVGSDNQPKSYQQIRIEQQDDYNNHLLQEVISLQKTADARIRAYHEGIEFVKFQKTILQEICVGNTSQLSSAWISLGQYGISHRNQEMKAKYDELTKKAQINQEVDLLENRQLPINAQAQIDLSQKKLLELVKLKEEWTIFCAVSPILPEEVRDYYQTHREVVFNKYRHEVEGIIKENYKLEHQIQKSLDQSHSTRRDAVWNVLSDQLKELQVIREALTDRRLKIKKLLDAYSISTVEKAVTNKNEQDRMRFREARVKIIDFQKLMPNIKTPFEKLKATTELKEQIAIFHHRLPYLHPEKRNTQITTFKQKYDVLIEDNAECLENLAKMVKQFDDQQQNYSDQIETLSLQMGKVQRSMIKIDSLFEVRSRWTFTDVIEKKIEEKSQSSGWGWSVVWPFSSSKKQESSPKKEANSDIVIINNS